MFKAVQVKVLDPFPSLSPFSSLTFLIKVEFLLFHSSPTLPRAPLTTFTSLMDKKTTSNPPTLQHHSSLLFLTAAVTCDWPAVPIAVRLLLLLF